MSRYRSCWDFSIILHGDRADRPGLVLAPPGWSEIRTWKSLHFDLSQKAEKRCLLRSDRVSYSSAFRRTKGCRSETGLPFTWFAR